MKKTIKIKVAKFKTKKRTAKFKTKKRTAKSQMKKINHFLKKSQKIQKKKKNIGEKIL